MDGTMQFLQFHFGYQSFILCNLILIEGQLFLIF